MGKKRESGDSVRYIPERGPFTVARPSLPPWRALTATDTSGSKPRRASGRAYAAESQTDQETKRTEPEVENL